MSILCPFPYGQGYISPQDTYNGEKYKLTDILTYIQSQQAHLKEKQKSSQVTYTRNI